MTTSFTFEAPEDLSVGRVRIGNAAGEVTSWVATPDNRAFFAHDIEPGFYTAEISPAGVAPQQVIFEVRAGEANTVVVPHFAALNATGSAITFLDVADHKAAVDSLFGYAENPVPEPSIAVPSTEGRRIRKSRGRSATPVLIEPTERRLSVGLSQEAEGRRESWRPFSGRARVELTGGKLDLTVEAVEGWVPASGERVRLSVAIERVRVERLLLPMYHGGVRISITPSPFSPSDVELQVLPEDTHLRGVARVLIAGTADEARAVAGHLLDSSDPDALMAKGAGDPWAAILSGLLLVRFAGVLSELTAEMAALLVAAVPWALDSHVIAARQRLYDRDRKDEAVAETVELLRRGQAMGAPYFAYTNQLLAELTSALSIHRAAASPALSEQVATIEARRLRDGPLQSSAGASFSWLRRDRAKLREGVIAPARNSTGELNPQKGTILFTGRIASGEIAFGAGAVPRDSGAPAEERGAISFAGALPDAPALARPPGPEEDPNAGRFGGRARVEGIALTAGFTELEGGRWVTIDLAVSGDESVTVSTGDVAWFCLRPTFQPQWVKVIFRGSRATLSLQSWGGFTVGVWLPSQRIELECDLSKLPGAPEAIRTR